MKNLLTLLPVAALGFVMVAGCNKEEAPMTGTSSPTRTPPPVTTPSTAMMPDYSTPAKVEETVVPAVKAALSAEPMLSGKMLDVHLMEKTIHIKGDVANNDEKRKIDEIVAPMMADASAAGYNFLNGTIVKG